jgi:hypothetical protein
MNEDETLRSHRVQLADHKLSSTLQEFAGNAVKEKPK